MDDRQKRIIAELGLNESDFMPKEVSTLDKVEAQTMWTALLTDTLLEEDVES